MTTAAATAATAEPSRAMMRLGSLPSSASRAAAKAATSQAYRQPCNVCELAATNTGITRYRTTIPSTDQTACTMADAAGGAGTALCVTQDCSGHSARRPGRPKNSRIEASTNDRPRRLLAHPPAMRQQRLAGRPRHSPEDEQLGQVPADEHPGATEKQDADE